MRITKKLHNEINKDLLKYEIKFEGDNNYYDNESEESIVLGVFSKISDNGDTFAIYLKLDDIDKEELKNRYINIIEELNRKCKVVLGGND